MSGGRVRIFEVGPRDGLQNEKSLAPTSQKVELINLLSQTGLDRIEVASFVSARWVPQMADAEEILARVVRRPGVRLAALTPNLKGYDRARAAGADEVAVFASASEGFSRRNINCSIAESLARFEPVLAAAKTDGIPVRGYVSCVIRCPYEADVDPSAVAEVAQALRDMGCYEISLGDTIGAGVPRTVESMLDAVLEHIPARYLAGHFHDTNGTALANITLALAMGLRVFDSSVGGLGGCPFAPGSPGNVSTVTVVQMLQQAGYETGIDMDKLRVADSFARALKRTAP